MFCAKDNRSPCLIPTTFILVILSVVSSPGAAAVTENDIVSWVRQRGFLSGNNNASVNDVVSWVTQRAFLGVSFNGSQNGDVRPVTPRAALGGSNSNGDDKTTSLVLAEERTHRKDPTDGLHYYNGGWNISNNHYISSVLFTGFPLFLIAAIWTVGFGLFLIITCICACCRRGSRRHTYSPMAYILSLVFLVLFTITAIVGSVVLFIGQDKFHGSTASTLNFVLLQADSTVDNLRNVSSSLTDAKKVAVDQMVLPQEVQNKIDQVDKSISSAADMLGNATEDNKDRIFRILDTVRIILIVVAAVMLVLAFLGLLLSILGLQCLVYILVVVGWILVAITFIISGVFLVLHNVMGDTCIAMNEWVINPTAHTALDDIIQCVDESTAQQALSQSKEVTFRMVQIVNLLIGNVSNANLPPRFFGALNYNQSGALVPLLCNPYNPDLTNRTCATGEVGLSNATQVWMDYVCQVLNNKCITVGRLKPDMYNQVSAATKVGYSLHHYGPFLANLVDCSFVRDTFTTIHYHYCPGLKRYSQWVYIGLVIVSSAIMLSLILWVLYGREKRHRRYAKLEPSSSRTSFEGKRTKLEPSSRRTSFEDKSAKLEPSSRRTSFEDKSAKLEMSSSRTSFEDKRP